MILDSSAVVAVLLGQPGWESLVEKLGSARLLAIGAPTLAETGIVLHAKLGSASRAALDRFLHDFAVSVLPFGDEHWREALDAFARWGKGRHPARLNFGDCLSYATAKLADLPLLWVGEDFARTDVDPA